MVSTRRFSKTPKAWEALPHPARVGRRAHALLLLANGRRSDRELSALLGDDVSELVQGLQQQGYLQSAEIVLSGDKESDSAACN